LKAKIVHPMQAGHSNLAVLISGSGTTLQNLIDRIADGSLEARIVQVIASKAGIPGIERACKAGLPVEVIRRGDFDSIEQFSQRVFSVCEQASVDLVCLGGWLSLLQIPDSWLGKVVNIHPSLLPKFGGKGMWGHHVHEAVLRSGETVSGCTVHFVNNEYDAGPIILQRVCPVLSHDTPQTLSQRVFEEEKIAYPEAIRRILSGRVRYPSGRIETVSH
jgi:formyltetrahydrofolate-dependent phosphoribosylglycinamide formyltransferase